MPIRSHVTVSDEELEEAKRRVRLVRRVLFVDYRGATTREMQAAIVLEVERVSRRQGHPARVVNLGGVSIHPLAALLAVRVTPFETPVVIYGATLGSRATLRRFLPYQRFVAVVRDRRAALAWVAKLVRGHAGATVSLRSRHSRSAGRRASRRA